MARLRRVLRVLMHIGHLLSSLLSREMEFDADRHAIHVAGHEPFIATMRLLPDRCLGVLAQAIEALTPGA